jgi:hypothetical protein
LKDKNRADLVLSTKGGMFDMRKGDWVPRVTPEAIEIDPAESLDHLGVSTIDLYWRHIDNPAVTAAPLIDALIAHRRKVASAISAPPTGAPRESLKPRPMRNQWNIQVLPRLRNSLPNIMSPSTWWCWPI